MLTIDSNLKNAKIEKSEVLKFLGKKSLEVGFYDSVTYPNGQNVAQVAFWNEFGTIHSPARPFFRNAIEINIKKWYASFGDLVASGGSDKVVMGKLGEIVKNDIVVSITKFSTPPNAQSTIRQKGSSKPLIDTGLMRRSVTYKVK